MAGRQAKTVTPHAINRMLTYAARSSNPERDRVIVLLSVKAGLRAAEIAKLTWPMVLDARGRVSDRIELADRAAKKGSGRRIPLHPDLRAALRALWAQGEAIGPVVRSARGGAMAANSIVNWFIALCAALDLKGCSSHSGRRTFITRAARLAHRAGGSLRDVQMLAGHRSIETTQRYIDGDSDAQRKLVALI
ncbi:MAG: site-specific integrase [Pseudomonadota bacterium]|nr:site-specific integrase [Pseudomonadota bacterium]